MTPVRFLWIVCRSTSGDEVIMDGIGMMWGLSNDSSDEDASTKGNMGVIFFDECICMECGMR